MKARFGSRNPAVRTVPATSTGPSTGSQETAFFHIQINALRAAEFGGLAVKRRLPDRTALARVETQAAKSSLSNGLQQSATAVQNGSANSPVCYLPMAPIRNSRYCDGQPALGTSPAGTASPMFLVKCLSAARRIPCSGRTGNRKIPNSNSDRSDGRGRALARDHRLTAAGLLDVAPAEPARANSQRRFSSS